MDAYDLSDKIKKYWCALFPKASGEINKSRANIKVCVWTSEGYREVKGVHIHSTLGFIELELDEE